MITPSSSVCRRTPAMYGDAHSTMGSWNFGFYASSRATFTGRNGAGTGAASTCTVAMSADRSVTATFGKSSGGKPKR